MGDAAAAAKGDGDRGKRRRNRPIEGNQTADHHRRRKDRRLKRKAFVVRKEAAAWSPYRRDTVAESGERDYSTLGGEWRGSRRDADHRDFTAVELEAVGSC